MKAPSKGIKLSTKPKKASNSQNGKKSRNGKGCMHNSCGEGLKHQEIDLSKLALLKVGELRSKILIGFYYLGGAKVSDLKLEDHKRQTKEESALNLVKKGYLHKQGPRYNLTEEGMNLVKPFVQYFRATA